MKKPKFSKPNSNLLSNAYGSPDYTNTHKLLASSMYIRPSDVYDSGDKAYMSNDELFYLADALPSLKSERYQRALIDMIHLQCDEDSVFRFMQFLSDDFKQTIMYSC
tara:strand:- start:291 stop:611 length:321 start_codon:yes stop_codon:yes gene_type:complete